MNFPLFEMIFDEAYYEESLKMSLVDCPAIEVNFLSFGEDKMKKFVFADDEKRIIYGAAMIPNMKIYRNDAEFGEYYVYFSEETIEKMASAFLKNHRFNIMHSEDTDAIEVLQSFILSDGIRPQEFSDLPDGTWILKAHISDDALWGKVKEGALNGFSVESFLSYAIEFNKVQKNNKTMNLSEIRAKLAEKILKCGSSVAINAEGAEVALEYAVETLANGTEVFVVDESGALVHPEDGEYTIDDTVWVIKDGLAEIKREDAPADEEEKKEEPAEEEKKEEEMEDEEKKDEEEEKPAEEEKTDESVVTEEPKEQEDENTLNTIVALTQRIEKLEAIIEEMNKKLATIDTTPLAEPFNKTTPRGEKKNNPYEGLFGWKK